MRKLLLMVIASLGLLAGTAQAHFTPKGHMTYAERVAEYEHRLDHTQDVARFFANHPQLATKQAGRNAIWQHKKLQRWSEKELAKLNSLDYLNLWSLKQLREQAKAEVRNGGTYSVRHGGCSERLQILSEELVNRYFAPYGTQAWARAIVARESGFCPGAVNTTYSDPGEQASCIAQFIPNIHTWVNYKRCKSDPAYSVAIFVRLSKGGRYTSPWNL